MTEQGAEQRCACKKYTLTILQPLGHTVEACTATDMPKTVPQSAEERVADIRQWINYENPNEVGSLRDIIAFLLAQLDQAQEAVEVACSESGSPVARCEWDKDLAHGVSVAIEQVQGEVTEAQARNARLVALVRDMLIWMPIAPGVEWIVAIMHRAAEELGGGPMIYPAPEGVTPLTHKLHRMDNFD